MWFGVDVSCFFFQVQLLAAVGYFDCQTSFIELDCHQTRSVHVEYLEWSGRHPDFHTAQWTHPLVSWRRDK